jgi:hypothetical protein
MATSPLGKDALLIHVRFVPYSTGILTISHLRTETNTQNVFDDFRMRIAFIRLERGGRFSGP